VLRDKAHQTRGLFAAAEASDTSCKGNENCGLGFSYRSDTLKFVVPAKVKFVVPAKDNCRVTVIFSRYYKLHKKNCVGQTEHIKVGRADPSRVANEDGMTKNVT